jgi:hypothetical protein
MSCACLAVSGVPLSSTWTGSSDAWDAQLYTILQTTTSIKWVDMLAIQAALWSNDCLDFEQALQLDEDSECLQCLPRELRTHFKIAIKTAQPIGKYNLLFSVHLKMCSRHHGGGLLETDDTFPLFAYS